MAAAATTAAAAAAAAAAEAEAATAAAAAAAAKQHHRETAAAVSTQHPQQNIIKNICRQHRNSKKQLQNKSGRKTSPRNKQQLRRWHSNKERRTKQQQPQE